MAVSQVEHETQLSAQLKAEGLSPTRWSNGPHAVYGIHEHPYSKILVVASGSITFIMKRKGAVTIRAGDRLLVSPHTPHSAVVGPSGVVCLEAHVPGTPSEK